MKKISLIAAIFALVLLPNILSAQTAPVAPGSWIGKLSAGGMELRVVFNLKVVTKDSIAATIDSPDQNAKDIPCGEVKLDSKKLFVDSPVINGQYSGTITGDSITGTWSQNGQEFPLNLKRLNIPPEK